MSKTPLRKRRACCYIIHSFLYRLYFGIHILGEPFCRSGSRCQRHSIMRFSLGHYICFLFLGVSRSFFFVVGSFPDIEGTCDCNNVIGVWIISYRRDLFTKLGGCLNWLKITYRNVFKQRWREICFNFIYILNKVSCI